MYQARRFWQHKPRSRGGVSHTATLKSSLELIHSARPAPTRPPRPTVPAPRSHTLPTHSQRSSQAFPVVPAAPVPARPWSAGGGEGRGGPSWLWRLAAHDGPWPSRPSIHRQACQIDALVIIIPLGPRPTLVKTPRPRSTLLFSSWLSSQAKSLASDRRKQRKRQ